MREPLLAVDFSADYASKPGILQDIRFEMAPGEILGVIGRSGSGKSTIALAIPRLLELRGGTVRGRIRFGGRDLMAAGGKELRQVRGKEIGLVLQSPMSALNPALRMETQFREAWRAHSSDAWQSGKKHARDLLERMGLPAGEDFLRRYPRQLSVGQAQRVAIGMAVLHGPKLLIADEPTSALDPATGAEILELFRGLNRQYGMALLYVSHDLQSVASLCHSVAVINEGRLVEWGPAGRVMPRASGDRVESSHRDLVEA